MPDRDRFNMLLPTDQKQRWGEYADESPEVDSLSHLVRLAVEKEIDGQNGSRENGADEEVSEQLGEVINQNRQLESRLQAMEARLGSIEQAVQEEPEVAKLANEVFGILPTGDEMERYDDPKEKVPPMDVDGIAYSGLTEDIAELLDASELQVRKAIDKLQTDTARVRETESHDGEPRYFKEV